MARKKKDRFGLRGEVHFQMAPLIDVVFLLLIFFICVTNFEKVDKIDLNLAYAKTAKEYQEGKSTMIVNVRRDGGIVVDGIEFVRGAKETLRLHMQKIADGSGGPHFRVAIRADRKAHMKEVKDVYRAAAHVGLTQISLITVTRQEKEDALPPGMRWPDDEIPEDEMID